MPAWSQRGMCFFFASGVFLETQRQFVRILVQTVRISCLPLVRVFGWEIISFWRETTRWFPAPFSSNAAGRSRKFTRFSPATSPKKNTRKKQKRFFFWPPGGATTIPECFFFQGLNQLKSIPVTHCYHIFFVMFSRYDLP